MSAVRISHGSASVEIESFDFAYDDRTVSSRYQADDVMVAVVRTLKAIGDDRAQDWLSAIEFGAEARGLDPVL